MEKIENINNTLRAYFYELYLYIAACHIGKGPSGSLDFVNFHKMFRVSFKSSIVMHVLHLKKENVGVTLDKNILRPYFHVQWYKI